MEDHGFGWTPDPSWTKLTKVARPGSNRAFFFFLMLIYLFRESESEREHVRRGGAEKEGERESQVGSTLSAQSPTWDSTSRTMRS